jgi:hypothetical protein
MSQEFRIAALMFVPYVVTISTLSVAPASTGPKAESDAVGAALVPLAMQGAYEDCRRMAELASADRVPSDVDTLARREAGPRTQSPAWLHKRQGEMESCLRKAAGAASPWTYSQRAAARL